MSAFVITYGHVDVLLHLALGTCSDARRDPRYSGSHGITWFAPVEDGEPWHKLPRDWEEDGLTLVGRMLHAECVASVAGRYPDDRPHERPGKLGELNPRGYTFRRTTRRFTIAEAFKALGCFEYQSCEHEGWSTSEAHAFCRSLERHLIGQTYTSEAYTAANWEWDRDELPADASVSLMSMIRGS